MQNIINSNMDKYFMYLRKSRKDEEAEAHGEGETLARHEKILTDLYLKMGISSDQVDVYREVVSGETIAQRPIIQEVLQLVECEYYVGGFVVEVERLARGDTMDQGLIAQTFKYSGTKIITPSKIFDPNNEFDEEYFEFGLYMSRREYKTINRRLKSGRNSSASEGKYVGSRNPYGYKRYKLEGQKGYSLKIIPEQYDTMQLMMRMHNDKLYSPEKIATELDKLGIPAPKGKYWSSSTIRDILSNPLYLGLIRWKYRKIVKKMENGKLVTTQPINKNGDVILVKGLHPPIFTKEDFDKAEEIRKSRTFNPLPSMYNLKNPICGVVICQKCKRSMRRMFTRGKIILSCTNPKCDNISSDLDIVEKKLIQSIQLLLDSYKKQSDEINIVQNTPNKELDILEEQNKKCKKEINELKSQFQKVCEFLEKGIYTIDLYNLRSSEISTKISELQKQISDRDNIINEYTNKKEKQIDLIPKIENVYYKTDNVEEKNKLLKEIIEKAEYLKTEKCYGKKANKENFELTIFPKLL